MKKAQVQEADEDGTDEVLASNFQKLMGETSFGRLREEIGGIGISALQAAKRGSKGMRLATIEKIAAHFDIQPYQMLLPDLGRFEQSKRTWPFDLLSPDHVALMSRKQLNMVEKFALDLLELQQDPPSDQSYANTPATGPGRLVALKMSTKRRVGGTSTGSKTKPGKSGSGEGG